jgi:hypothetical protein
MGYSLDAVPCSIEGGLAHCLLKNDDRTTSTQTLLVALSDSNKPVFHTISEHLGFYRRGRALSRRAAVQLAVDLTYSVQ